jgi:zinc transport system substrate-binding protein
MKKNVLIMIIFLILFFACKERAIDRNLIFTTVLPQKFFIEKITGSRFNVKVMIPPGHSPATYEPTSKQMMEFTKAALYFRIGHVAFEKSQIDSLKSINSSLKIYDISSGVRLIKESHSHDADHVDDKEIVGVDPHIWLSPKAVKIMSRNIYKALVLHDPDNKKIYYKNMLNFIKELDALDKRLHKILRKVKNKEFLVYHPAWTYFAHDYNLKQIAIERDGKAPAAEYIKQIISKAKKHNIKVVFVQKEFAANNAEAIAADIGGHVVQLSPLEENWLLNMQKIAHAFEKALR